MGLRLNVWTSIVLFVLAAPGSTLVGRAPPRPRGGRRTREPDVEHVGGSDEAAAEASGEVDGTDETDEADEARPADGADRVEPTQDGRPAGPTA